MYLTQADHFLNSVIKKQKPIIDILDGVKTQKVIDTSFLSSKKKKMTKIR